MTAVGRGFRRSWLGDFFSPQHSAENIETKHQQLYLPCSGNNQFKSGNKKISEPSRLV